MQRYKQSITVTEAAAKAEVTRVAIRDWCCRYDGLAKFVGGMWRINPAELQKILDGERPARRDRPL